MPTNSVLLEVRGLAVSYRGGGIGVTDLSVTVDEGDVVTLVGPNGAGKTSSLKGIAGVLPRENMQIASGSIFFKGEDITSMGPLRRSRLGLAIVPEQDKIFSELTVSENLRIAADAKQSEYITQLDRAMAVFPALKQHLLRRAGYLSGGQRQMLAIASALCSKPSLLLVDELTLGLSPDLIETMAASLHEIINAGLPILMAEQNVALSLQMSDRMCVLDGGRVLATGTPDELKSTGILASAFLGNS